MNAKKFGLSKRDTVDGMVCDAVEHCLKLTRVFYGVYAYSQYGGFCHRGGFFEAARAEGCLCGLAKIKM